jgi:hypothetical protein
MGGKQEVRTVAAILRLLLAVLAAVSAVLLFMDTEHYPATLALAVGGAVVAFWGMYTGMRDL